MDVVAQWLPLALICWGAWKVFKAFKDKASARAMAAADAAADSASLSGARADVGGVHIHLHVGNSGIEVDGVGNGALRRADNGRRDGELPDDDYLHIDPGTLRQLTGGGRNLSSRDRDGAYADRSGDGVVVPSGAGWVDRSRGRS